MASDTSYTNLRENLSSVLDQVVDNQEVVIVRRRGGGRDVALIPASELSSLIETAYLLRSPANSKRLLGALRRAQKGDGTPSTMAELKAELNLGQSR